MSDCWWVNGKPVPDVKRLTDAELVALWKANRQGPVGYCAADEGMRRREEEMRRKVGGGCISKGPV